MKPARPLSFAKLGAFLISRLKKSDRREERSNVGHSPKFLFSTTLL